MTSNVRFTKAAVLAALDARAIRIGYESGFDRQNGTAQLMPRLDIPQTSLETKRLIDRAVEYGRMRAFEEFADAIGRGLCVETKD